MLQHVGPSLQRPRSQLLHQVLHLRIQHPLLGKVASAFSRIHEEMLPGEQQVQPANREEGPAHPPHHHHRRHHQTKSASYSKSSHRAVIIMNVIIIIIITTVELML